MGIVRTAVWRHRCPRSRSVKSDSGVTITCASAQLTSSGHLSDEWLGSWRRYCGAKVKSVHVAWSIQDTGTME